MTRIACFRVWTRYEPSSGYDFPEFSLSGPEFIDYRAQTRALEEVAAFTQPGATLTTDDGAAEPIRVSQVLGTANLFATLGAQAAIGRTFRADEDQPGAPCVVVLSDWLWLDAFGGDPSAVGRTVRLSGTPCEIVGVMPAGFAFPAATTQLWRTVTLDPSNAQWSERLNHGLRAVGRLAPGVTLAEAEAELRTLMANWREANDHYEGHFIILRPYLDEIVADVRPALTMLLGAAGLVLLVICANLASLLLARGEGRRRELAVRFALGAGRRRLVAQLLTESALLALAGGALGVTAAMALLDGLLSLYPGTLPRAEAIALDWRALAFAAAATGLTVLLFGLLPALRASSASPNTVLRAHTRGVVGGRSHLMRALVVAEVAFSVMLIVCAGLLLRSYENIRSVDLGLDAEGVYTVGQALPASTYADPPAVYAFYASLIERLAALPGVESAGAISNLPLRGGSGGMNDFAIDGRPQPRPGEPTWNAGHVMVTPGYFETMRTPLIEGRLIDASDVPDGPRVAVINEEAARRYWPGESPVGRRVRHGSDEPGAFPWITIVGVVGNMRANGVQAEQPPQIFFPHADLARAAVGNGRFMSIVVRAAGDPLGVAAAVNATLREADPSLPPIAGALMQDVVRVERRPAALHVAARNVLRRRRAAARRARDSRRAVVRRRAARRRARRAARARCAAGGASAARRRTGHVARVHWRCAGRGRCVGRRSRAARAAVRRGPERSRELRRRDRGARRCGVSRVLRARAPSRAHRSDDGACGRSSSQFAAPGGSFAFARQRARKAAKVRHPLTVLKPHENVAGRSCECPYETTSWLDLREPLAAAAALPRPDRRAGRVRLVVLAGALLPAARRLRQRGRARSRARRRQRWKAWTRPDGLNETVIMLVVLGLIDVVMISNLLIMVIVGGYETFVSRMNLEGHPDQPEWLSHVNASVLKVKLATAIIGISSIHLLKTFINAAAYDEKTLIAQVGIHITFLLSAMAIGASDRLMPHAPSHAKERA